MTSIRAPWRVRTPRDGRDGFDALPALDGLHGKNGKDGKDGERGQRGLLVLREAAQESVLPALVPWRAPYERDELNRLTTRVTAGPMGSPPMVELIPIRDEFDDIRYVDILPIGIAE